MAGLATLADKAHAKLKQGETRPPEPRLLGYGGAGPVLFGQAAEGGVEAGVEGLLQRLRRQAGRLLAVVGEIHEPRDERPRVRTTQGLLAIKVVEQIPDGLLVE